MISALVVLLLSVDVGQWVRTLRKRPVVRRGQHVVWRESLQRRVVFSLKFRLVLLRLRQSRHENLFKISDPGLQLIVATVKLLYALRIRCWTARVLTAISALSYAHVKVGCARLRRVSQLRRG